MLIYTFIISRIYMGKTPLSLKADIDIELHPSNTAKDLYVAIAEHQSRSYVPPPLLRNSRNILN